MSKVDNLIDRADLALMAIVTRYYARVFRGSGQFETVWADDLKAARHAAGKLFTGRPITIYGETPRGRSVFIEVIDPRHDALKLGDNPMTVYLLTYVCPAISNPVVYKFPANVDKVKAAAFGRTLPENQGILPVETADDLRNMSGPLMVKIYNELVKKRNADNINRDDYEPGHTVTKFQDTNVARNRLYKEIIEAAVDAPADALTVAETTAREDASNEPPLTQPAPSDNPTNNQENAAMAAKTKTARKPKVDGDSKISILAEENPKRKGSAAAKRFDLYKNGMKVATFLEKGGTTADLSYDVKKKYIKLEKA